MQIIASVILTIAILSTLSGTWLPPLFGAFVISEHMEGVWDPWESMNKPE